jgi:aryl-alcohol dehydrogenase-like predicted oxidoreductase
MYNLVKRQAEVELLALAQSERVGVISYSPLGGGLLTGKYSAGKKPPSGRLIEQDNYARRYREEQYYEVADRFTAYAGKRGIHPATLAVAWVKSHSAITAPIIGARNIEQLKPSLDSLSIDMTPEWRQEVSALSIAPPPATDRSEEA